MMLHCKCPSECDSQRILKIGQYLTRLWVKFGDSSCSYYFHVFTTKSLAFTSLLKSSIFAGIIQHSIVLSSEPKCFNSVITTFNRNLSRQPRLWWQCAASLLAQFIENAELACSDCWVDCRVLAESVSGLATTICWWLPSIESISLYFCPSWVVIAS